MHSYCYGTQTVLAYIFNHFFFNAVHFMYLSKEYYPYRRKNPRSSSPHRIYEELYEWWKDKDEFNKHNLDIRMKLRTGISAHESMNTIDAALARRLKSICDRIDVGVFYPLVYRVDIKTIDRKRLKKAGSGLRGSSEYLVRDLHESEISDILFLDYEGDDIIKLVKYEFEYFRRTSSLRRTPNDVLVMLENRMNRNARTKMV